MNSLGSVFEKSAKLEPSSQQTNKERQFISVNTIKENFGKILLTMFLGTAVIVLIGTLVLGFFIGFKNGVTYGLTPFLLGAVIKIILGAIFVKVI